MSGQFSQEVVRQGFLAYSLIGQWNTWIKRRVEKFELVGDGTVRRHQSIDFRLHESVFGSGSVRWNQVGFHYVPITLLEKAPFANLDLRDEAGASLPLITRRKNAAIAAAVLSAGARTIAQRHILRSPVKQPALHQALFADHEPLSTLRLPGALERAFFDLSYLPYEGGASQLTDRTARLARESLLEASIRGRETDAANWTWTRGDSEWAASASFEDWALVLLQDVSFSQLTYDLARLFLVCVPVADEPDRRRLIKLSYEEPISDPGLKAIARFRERRRPLAKRIRAFEDAFEGLSPEHEQASREWLRPAIPGATEQRDLGVWERIAQGLAWRARPISLDVPGTGFGGTFHFEFAAPKGTQIRRARLRSAPPVGFSVPGQLEARRYAKNADRCHLYLDGRLQQFTGRAEVLIKPRTSTIIRATALVSAVISIGFIAWIVVQPDFGRRVSTFSAILLLLPSLVAAQAARPGDHPVTSRMVFGLKLIAMAVTGAGVYLAALVGARADPGVYWGYWALGLAISLALTFTLLIAWRLTGRDWPVAGEV